MLKYISLIALLILQFSMVSFGQSNIDLTLRSSSVSQKVEIGTEGTITFTLENQGSASASDIKVFINIPYFPPFVKFVSAIGSKGSFDVASGIWSLPSLIGQESAILTMKYTPMEYGVWYAEGEVYSVNEVDSDSSPNNGVDTEDDFSRSCFSMPIKVSGTSFGGRQIILEDSKITNIVWKKEGQIIQNQNANTLSVIAEGSYTFESPTFICPTQGCCPYIFEQGIQTLCCEPLEYFMTRVASIQSVGESPQILTLQPGPADGEDAEVTSVLPDAVYNTGVFMDPLAYTQFNGTNIKRSFIKFDISELPSSITIDSAFLHLYFSQALINLFPNFTGHSGDNQLKIQRVVSNWSSNTLTWNNQPNVTSVNEVTVPRATSEKQNYKIDVKTLVQDMRINGNLGFGIKHATEIPSKITSLTTSEEVNPMIRPKLVIYYH